MNATTQRGFLVLADITGFTPFVADTELDHSNEILNEILKGVLSYLTPKFTLAEVEGDAVFVYAPAERFADGQAIIDIIESSYYAFRDRKGSLERIKTCKCKACEMAPLLDLKFIVHYGEYIMNNVSGKNKPLGTSVNVVHRLLKNSVSEVTGWKAYMLLTKDFVDAVGLNAAKFHRETQRYDHIGAVETFSINLDESYRNAVEERVVYLSKEDSDVVVEKEFSLPPALLWDWIADPARRTRWSLASDWKIGLRPLGRMGRGATNHCVNSKIMETVLDYRPFAYYTSSMTRGLFKMTLTSAFRQTTSGTRLSWHLKINSILPRVFSRFVCKVLAAKGMKINESFDELERLIRREKSEVDVLAP
jgi:hypothetical protein